MHTMTTSYPKKGRVMGIDYGTKRVGIALSDEERRLAFPHGVIATTSRLVGDIEQIAHENNIGEIVIGESRDYKGSPNPIFRDVEVLRGQLEEKSYRVVLEPEFMTSMQAERVQGKHDKIDASAAAIILQSFLDRTREG